MREENSEDGVENAFVYRIIAAADWVKAQETGIVPYGDIDRRDGYMHLSTRAQTLETAARYFAGRGDLLVLEIMCTDIKDNLQFEAVAERGGERFPHLYAQLPVTLVRRALTLSNMGSGFEFAGEAE